VTFSLTCNQMCVLLDCCRGYHPDRHVGTLPADLLKLTRLCLVVENPPGPNFDYSLTERGRAFADTILGEWELNTTFVAAPKT